MPDFSTLKTRVKDYLIDVPNKTDALVGDWLNRAVVKAEERFDFKHMQVSQDYTTTVDTRVLSATLPSGWKSLRDPPFYTRDDEFVTTQEMGHAVSAHDMRRMYAEEDDGAPDFLLFDPEDESVKVYPLPDGGSDYDDGEYRITVPYWKYSDTLVNNADTNWFTDNAEWYLVFFAAAEGMLFNRDHEEASLYFQRAQEELSQKVRTNKETQSRRPRMLVPRTGAYGVSRKPPRKL